MPSVPARRRRHGLGRERDGLAPTLSVAEMLAAATAASSDEGNPTLSAQLLGASAQALGGSGASGASSGNRWSRLALSSPPPPPRGSSPPAIPPFSAVCRRSSTASPRRSTRARRVARERRRAWLNLVETFANPALVGSLPPTERTRTLGNLGGALANVLSATRDEHHRHRLNLDRLTRRKASRSAVCSSRHKRHRPERSSFPRGRRRLRRPNRGCDRRWRADRALWPARAFRWTRRASS